MKIRSKTVTALLFFILVLLTSFRSTAQSTAVSCAEFHDGIFYSYPVNSKASSISVRTGNTQIERLKGSRDSVIWDVEWIDECTYSLRYRSGSKPLSAADQKAAKKTLLIYEISSRTDQYYTYIGYLEKKGGQTLNSDTMWLNERPDHKNETIFSAVKNPASITKRNFNDSSSYALLYLYRPGKMTNSLGNYPVYFNNNPIWAANNGSWMAFKVFKEGRVEIKSELQGDASSVVVDVRFGKKTYVKSMIHWRFANRNFNLEMAEVTASEAEAEIAALQYR